MPEMIPEIAAYRQQVTEAERVYREAEQNYRGKRDGLDAERRAAIAKVEQPYLEKRNALDDEYRADRTKATAGYAEQIRELDTELRTITNQFTNTREQAVDAFGKSGDPLVRWVAAHVMPRYPNEAMLVLERMPCTRRDLRDLAANQGWCVYADYESDAIAAGAMPRDLMSNEILGTRNDQVVEEDTPEFETPDATPSSASDA